MNIWTGPLERVRRPSLVLAGACVGLVTLAVLTFSVAARVASQRPVPTAAKHDRVESLSGSERPTPSLIGTAGPTASLAAVSTSTSAPARPTGTGKPPASTVPASRKSVPRAVSTKSRTATTSTKPKAKASPATVTPANLTPVHMQLVNRVSGRCLDSGPADATTLEGEPYTLPCSGGDYQQWSAVLVRAGSRVVLLRDNKTQLCLGMRASSWGFTRKCNTSDTTIQWTWQGTNANSVYVQVSSGSCLDGNAKGDVLPSKCGTTTEHWSQQT